MQKSTDNLQKCVKSDFFIVLIFCNFQASFKHIILGIFTNENIGTHSLSEIINK